MWVNHEYISNGSSSMMTGASLIGQMGTLATHLQYVGTLFNDITIGDWAEADRATFIQSWKRQVGGSWFRVVQDTANGQWKVDTSATARRYDATSGTLVKVTGHTLSAIDTNDVGQMLPEGVVAGIHSDCSGGQTPWGTIISAEENVQGAYGDLETCWNSNNDFVPNADTNAFAPGKNVSPNFEPSTSADFGRSPDALTRHRRDMNGYLTEMDVGQPADEYYGKNQAGVGHRKIGAMGRARWENAAFAVGADWKLKDGQKVVMYGGDDRQGGRIFKFVSKNAFAAGMTKAQVRSLLDDGDLYVAHFAGLDNTTGHTLEGGAAPSWTAPGQGKWIHLSVNNMTDEAPNAAAWAPGTKVGTALKDVSWNGIGGFPTDNDVRQTLFTASNKIGVMELNRPEDLEWNPKAKNPATGAVEPLLFIAFTNHTRNTALDQAGRIATFDRNGDGTWSKLATRRTGTRRADSTGSIFAMRESNAANPGESATFEFIRVWKGSQTGAGSYGLYDAGSPDNLLIDREGGVWFGTDGNFGNNGVADAVYFLDLDPAHDEGRAGIVNPTFGKAIRVATAPADAEATGPAFTPDMRTLFFNVQHPGEDVPSTWPQVAR